MMNGRPSDKPMARAQAHLASGRFAEAMGAFRAALAIDASALSARLGLAEAMAARGNRAEAITGLLEAAEKHAELGQHAQALSLYGKALVLDPQRVALHLDVAVVERAMGRHAAAVARVEGLAEHYMNEGRTDEAAELLRFAATWDETIEEIEPEPEDFGAVSPGRAPQATSETVICATVLIRPDGTLLFGPRPSPGPSPAPRSATPAAAAAAAAAAPRSATPGAAAPRTAAPRTATPAAAAAAPRTAAAASRSAAPASRRAPPRRVAPPPVRAAIEDVDPDMVTRVASRPRPPARPPAHPPARAAAKPAVPPARVQPSSAALVERLRRRAGLALEASAVPRSTKARGTESIALRREQEEVTHRFHRPRTLDRATTI